MYTPHPISIYSKYSIHICGDLLIYICKLLNNSELKNMTCHILSVFCCQWLVGFFHLFPEIIFSSYVGGFHVSHSGDYMACFGHSDSLTSTIVVICPIIVLRSPWSLSSLCIAIVDPVYRNETFLQVSSVLACLGLSL